MMNTNIIIRPQSIWVVMEVFCCCCCSPRPLSPSSSPFAILPLLFLPICDWRQGFFGTLAMLNHRKLRQHITVLGVMKGPAEEISHSFGLCHLLLLKSTCLVKTTQKCVLYSGLGGIGQKAQKQTC